MQYIIARDTSSDTVVVLEQYTADDFKTAPTVIPTPGKIAEFWGPRGEEFARLVFNSVGIATDNLPPVNSKDAAGELRDSVDEQAADNSPIATLPGWPPTA